MTKSIFASVFGSSVEARPWTKVLLAVLAALLLARFVLAPSFAWLDGQQRQIAGLRRQVAEKRLLQERKEEIAARLTKIRADQEAYRAYFFDSGQDPEQMQLAVQKELERLAAETGVKISNLDWMTPTGGQGMMSAPVSIVCQGGFERMVAFIGGIEGTARHFGIEGMALRPRNNELQAELTVVAYGLALGE